MYKGLPNTHATKAIQYLVHRLIQLDLGLYAKFQADYDELWDLLRFELELNETDRLEKILGTLCDCVLGKLVVEDYKELLEQIKKRLD